MKHENLAFSIPADLKAILNNHVGKFISDAIRKALEKENLKNEKSLDAAYAAASHDAMRLETLQDWNALDDVSDLWREVEKWDWLKKSTEKKLL